MAYPLVPTEKWDVHTHTTLAPETYAALERFGRYADFVRVRAKQGDACRAEMVNGRGEVVRTIEANAYDAATRAADCTAHGVTRQVISPTPMMIPDAIDHPADAAEICKILNDGNAAIVAQFPERFAALTAIPMLHADLAIRELERARNELGMRGVEINSNINGLELDDPRFFPIFAAAAEMNLAVFIHPWGGFMSPTEERLKRRMNAGRNWRPWLLGMGMETALAFDALRSGGVHERLPALRVLYAHGGGAFPALLGRMAHGAYCRPDLFEQASRLDPYRTARECGVYADSLTHDPWMLELLVQTLGANRIALGSDYPYPLGELDCFDGTTNRDSLGNRCPRAARKAIYPGHTIEHLPACEADQTEAWRYFHWLSRENAAGERKLPCLSDAQKRQMLSETAKEWLGIAQQ